ncbi:MAG: ATP-dependent Clp protease protease subunit [Clostridium sp.]
MQCGIDMLSEVNESIVNAYEQKTGLPRNKISKMMDSETWFSAKKAVELGFADKVLYETDQDESGEGFIFDKVTVTNALLRKIPKAKQTQVVAETGTPHEQLLKRLDLIKY